MDKSIWKKEICTIPNFLSLFRIILIPFYVSVYWAASGQRQYLLAGGLLALSCFTDFLDGRIARQFHMTSSFGKVLDPVADKATQLSLMLCLSARYPSMRMVLWIFLFKESLQATAAVLLFRHGLMLDGALPAGKISTTILFAGFIYLVIFHDTPKRIVDLICVLDGIFLLLSMFAYCAAYWGQHRQTHED